jgi:hypothetical protein
MELNALLYVQFGLRDAQMQEKEGGETARQFHQMAKAK